jgi:hypothetical protein
MTTNPVQHVFAKEKCISSTICVCVVHRITRQNRITIYINQTERATFYRLGLYLGIPFYFSG